MSNPSNDGWEALPPEREDVAPPSGFLPGSTMPGADGAPAAPAVDVAERPAPEQDVSGTAVTAAFDPGSLSSVDGSGTRPVRKVVRVVPVPDNKLRLLAKPSRPAGMVMPPIVLASGWGFAAWLWLAVGSQPLAVLTAVTAVVGSAFCWVMLRD